MATTAHYTATAYSKEGRKLGMSERNTREEAEAAAFRRWPTAKRVSCGYGYLGGFDIRSTERWQWAERELNEIAKAKGIEPLLEGAHEVECEPLYTDTDAIGALMPDGTVLDQWDERLRSVGASPIFPERKPAVTETHEPVRPMRAPEGGGAYAGQMIFGGWRSYYGEPHWPSRCYWLLPTQDYSREF